jgi:hypothetical protein
MAGLTVAVVSFSAAAVAPVGTAGADQLGATKAQISVVEAQIEAGAGQLHTLTLAYQQANLNAGILAQQVQADQVQLNQLQTRVSGSQSLLRREVLLSYTGGTGSNLGAPAGTNDPSIRAEYLQVATGNIHDAVDQYRAQQRQVAAAMANLAQQERASQAAAAATAAARQQALSQAAAEQAQLDQLQGQLNQFVEAAAVAAQQKAAAPPAPTVAAPAVAAPAPAPTQGLPVNGGLVSVVHTIVAPPAPTPPAPPPATPGYTDAGGVWLQLRECESSDNYAENTGNGFYGAYQFSPQTWTNLGYPGRPDLESHQMQDQAAMKLQAESGWGQWPACSAALGLH